MIDMWRGYSDDLKVSGYEEETVVGKVARW